VRKRAVKPLIEVESMRRIAELAGARRSLLDAVKTLWVNPAQPFTPGHHTRVICERIDRAKADYKRGKSTNMIITVPFRHGKSDLSSRYGPATLLGWDPDLEIILASYGSTLSADFSRDIKTIVEQPKFREVYPEFPGWDPASNAADQRRVLGRRGKLFALGMSGGATGRGANILILDDAFKNREEAESKTVRDSRWSSFLDDFFTRLAPVHIVFIVQTRWHVDDIIGRIHARNNPEAPEYEAAFPKFDTLHFRARGPENIDTCGSQYLFPERFSEAWYEEQFGAKTAYAAASLLQGEPYIRGGNLLKTDAINWLVPVQEFPAMPTPPRWVRHWDLAHSEKERAKDDPDYTAGARVAVFETPQGDTIFVDDVRMFQHEASERNARIIEAAKYDAAEGIPQSVEANGAQKSGYTTLRDILRGVAVVSPYQPQGDKVTRAGYIEPAFEAGNVWIRCNPALKPTILEQISNFPTPGVHDDVVDVISDGYQCARRRNAQSGGKSVSNNMAAALVE
jgi:predicted phage terminase large subunit-like protein